MLVEVCRSWGGCACVDECCCDDDARSEVFRYEECPFWDPDTSVSCSVDGESGACRPLLLEEAVGQRLSRLPKRDPISITNMAETRTPILPS